MSTEVVVVVCDRCGSAVAGVRSETFTSGFYDATDSYWSQYARDGERIICDACMFEDELYRKDYGYKPLVPDEEPKERGDKA